MQKMNAIKMLRSGSAVLAVVLCSGPLLAAPKSPCGDLEMAGGAITLGIDIPVALPMAEKTRICLALVAKELSANIKLQNLTLAARVPTSQRAKLPVLDFVEKAKKIFVDGGIDAKRISGIAPHASNGEKSRLVIAYTEKNRERAVAWLQFLSGRVDVGAGDDALRSGRAGMGLPVGYLVRTNEKATASVRLADGSNLRLAEKSMVRLEELEFAGDRRMTRIALLAGSVESDVVPCGEPSCFQVIASTAVAGVRGTAFRLTRLQEGGLRLETLDGRVNLAGAENDADVDKGQGTRMLSDGRVETPRGLLEAPVVVGPIFGDIAPDYMLRWKALPGASAYIIEIAGDPDFKRDVTSMYSAAVEAPLQAISGSGRRYWRVAALDADSFVGMFSKIYSFNLTKAKDGSGESKH